MVSSTSYSDTDLYAPHMGIKTSQKSFSYRGVHLWNALKPASNNMSPLFAFKASIKQQNNNRKLVTIISQKVKVTIQDSAEISRFLSIV